MCVLSPLCCFDFQVGAETLCPGLGVLWDSFYKSTVTVCCLVCRSSLMSMFLSQLHSSVRLVHGGYEMLHAVLTWEAGIDRSWCWRQVIFELYNFYALVPANYIARWVALMLILLFDVHTNTYWNYITFLLGVVKTVGSSLSQRFAGSMSQWKLEWSPLKSAHGCCLKGKRVKNWLNVNSSE